MAESRNTHNFQWLPLRPGIFSCRRNDGIWGKSEKRNVDGINKYDEETAMKPYIEKNDGVPDNNRYSEALEAAKETVEALNTL